MYVQTKGKEWMHNSVTEYQDNVAMITSLR